MSRRLLIVGGILAGGVAIAALLCVVFFGRIGAWVVRHRYVPRLEKLLGRDVHVTTVRVDRHTIVLEGITVGGAHDPAGRPLVTVERVTVPYEMWPTLTGDARIGDVTVEKPVIAVARAADGTDNLTDVIERLRKPKSGGAPGSRGRMRPRSVHVTGGSATLDDRQHGVRLSIAAIDGEASLAPGAPRTASVTLDRIDAKSDLGPSAGAARVTWRRDAATGREGRLDVQGGTLGVWAKLSLTGIDGFVATSDGNGRAQIDLAGGYGGVEGKLWRAEGWIDPQEKSGELHVRGDRFTLDKLAPILAGTPVETPEKTSISASLDLGAHGDELTFSGELSLAGLTLFHPALSDLPVKDLGFHAAIRGAYAGHTRVLTLESLGIDVKKMHVNVDGMLALPGGVEEGVADLAPGAVPASRREKRHVRAHVVVPELPCQQALAALPPEMTPALQGFKLTGKFSSDVHVDIDWADLDALDLGGSVGIAGCKVQKAPEAVDSERLKGEFEHMVEVEENKWISFMIGPSNPDYVPIAEISPHLLNSLMTTEDSYFYKHHGFIVHEFRSALITDLKEGYFKYGASSITMQMVKNVLLYREKTISRKLQELFLTWYVETTLDKDRILEIYVNAIEFGPGIYGIGPAARHYFGKAAKDLNPVESAFFSSILPNPKQRYLQYCEGQINKWTDAKVQRIVKLMHERERLTDAEFALAQITPLVFDRTEALPEDECKEMTRKMIKNGRPTTPGAAKDKDKDKKKGGGSGTDRHRPPPSMRGTGAPGAPGAPGAAHSSH